MAIDAPAPVRRNESRGVELLDDGRSGRRRADLETPALVKARLQSRPLEPRGALSLHRVDGGRRRRRGLARLIFWDGDAYTQPIAHYLDRSLLGRVSVDLGVALVEPLPRHSQRRGREPLEEQSLQRRAQLVAL